MYFTVEKSELKKMLLFLLCIYNIGAKAGFPVNTAGKSCL